MYDNGKDGRNSGGGSFDDDVFEALPPIPKKYLREFSPDTETPLIEIGTDERSLDSVSVRDSGERPRAELSDGSAEDVGGYGTPYSADGGNSDMRDIVPPSGRRSGWRGTEPAPAPQTAALPQEISLSGCADASRTAVSQQSAIQPLRRERSAADDEISELFARLRSRGSAGQSSRGGDAGYSVAVPRSSSFRDTGLIRSYEPRHPFLRHVDILTWPSAYNFYERFRADAVSFFSREGQEVPYAEFVSYVPQYSMMTDAQLAYYFRWRSCLRAGKLIKASRSYVLLFLYEVINLPDLIAPEDGVKLLCRVITGYAETVIGIRNSVIPWLRDYCLIHGVSLPREYMHDIAAIAGRYTALPEFFVCYDIESGAADPLSLASVLSHYAWQESKYMTAAGRGCYERHMPAAITAAMTAMGGGATADGSLERYIAESYSGAVCSSEVKCRLRIDYIRACGCADSEAVTAAVKYAENQVRRLLGIKARFKITALPEEMRRAIDRYFAPVIEREESVRRAGKRPAAPPEVAPEYEHFYAPESSGMSFDRAMEIERRSWRMTERLEEAFSDAADVRSAVGGASDGNVSAENAAGKTGTERTSDKTGANGALDKTCAEGAAGSVYTASATGAAGSLYTASATGTAGAVHTTGSMGTADDADEAAGAADSGSPELIGLRMLLDGDGAGFERYALSAAILPAALCDRINELLYDDIGDSIAEHTASGYAITEDYRDEAEEFLRSCGSGR